MQAQDWITPFERSKGKASATYQEAIDFYRGLDQAFGNIDIQKVGPTDASLPLHVVYYSGDGSFDLAEWHRKGKLIILINNAIHPGEPDGIDAIMMLMRDVATGEYQVPENVVLAVIPVFNIGGALNRGSYSRANQNGPLEYGFRGNAQNLDLNRDFIKLDAKETQSLVHLFHQLDPDIFIDNHVSNGADYQHVMTLLSVNPAKQGYHMGDYLRNQFEPAIYRSMKDKGYDLVPYVNHWGETPDKGWQQFYEPPRFASGFAALFGTFAFVPETHMLKPYKVRVLSTLALMESFIEFGGVQGKQIRKAREQERKLVARMDEFTIDWKVDTTAFSTILFKGYKASRKPSKVSGQPRLYYDRSQPYKLRVPFYNKFLPSLTARAPRAYVIPGGWHRAVRRLQINDVVMQRIERDTVMTLTVYRIGNLETTPRPFEGHYLHSKVQFASSREEVRLYKGDYIIPIDQPAKRFLMETLEPNAPDAYFAWGFFDAILQQKEYFSDYVFEDEAASLLHKDPDLRKLLEEKKKTDAAFAKNGQAQLDFIYRHSPYYEQGHLRYPVFRID